MVAAPNNKLFIGARTCTGGCLTIVDSSSLSAVVSTAGGSVTGIQPIPERPVVYVVEGGELIIYDSATSQPQSTQIEITGNAQDVIFVD